MQKSIRKDAVNIRKEIEKWNDLWPDPIEFEYALRIRDTLSANSEFTSSYSQKFARAKEELKLLDQDIVSTVSNITSIIKELDATSAYLGGTACRLIQCRSKAMRHTLKLLMDAFPDKLKDFE